MGFADSPSPVGKGKQAQKQADKADAESGGHVSDGVNMDDIDENFDKVEVEGKNGATGEGNNTYQHYQPQVASLAGQKRGRK